MISPIGIISIPLYFFWRDKYILPVLSSLRVEAPANVLDFRWVTVRFVAAAGAWVIWHAPRRVEFLVEELILRWMVTRGVVFSSVLRLE